MSQNLFEHKINNDWKPILWHEKSNTELQWTYAWIFRMTFTINNYDKPSTWITGSLQINDLVAYLLTKITDLFAWLAT